MYTGEWTFKDKTYQIVYNARVMQRMETQGLKIDKDSGAAVMVPLMHAMCEAASIRARHHKEKDFGAPKLEEMWDELEPKDIQTIILKFLEVYNADDRNVMASAPKKEGAEAEASTSP